MTKFNKILFFNLFTIILSSTFVFWTYEGLFFSKKIFFGADYIYYYGIETIKEYLKPWSDKYYLGGATYGNVMGESLYHSINWFRSIFYNFFYFLLGSYSSSSIIIISIFFNIYCTWFAYKFLLQEIFAEKISISTNLILFLSSIIFVSHPYVYDRMVNIGNTSYYFGIFSLLIIFWFKLINNTSNKIVFLFLIKFSLITGLFFGMFPGQFYIFFIWLFLFELFYLLINKNINRFIKSILSNILILFFVVLINGHSVLTYITNPYFMDINVMKSHYSDLDYLSIMSKSVSSIENTFSQGIPFKYFQGKIALSFSLIFYFSILFFHKNKKFLSLYFTILIIHILSFGYQGYFREIIRVLFEHVPGYGALRNPNKIIYILVFFKIFIFYYSLDKLLQKKTLTKYRLILIIFICTFFIFNFGKLIKNNNISDLYSKIDFNNNYSKINNILKNEIKDDDRVLTFPENIENNFLNSSEVQRGKIRFTASLYNSHWVKKYNSSNVNENRIQKSERLLSMMTNIDIFSNIDVFLKLLFDTHTRYILVDSNYLSNSDNYAKAKIYEKIFINNNNFEIIFEGYNFKLFKVKNFSWILETQKKNIFLVSDHDVYFKKDFSSKFKNTNLVFYSDNKNLDLHDLSKFDNIIFYNKSIDDLILYSFFEKLNLIKLISINDNTDKNKSALISKGNTANQKFFLNFIKQGFLDYNDNNIIFEKGSDSVSLKFDNNENAEYLLYFRAYISKNSEHIKLKINNKSKKKIFAKTNSQISEIDGLRSFFIPIKLNKKSKNIIEISSNINEKNKSIYFQDIFLINKKTFENKKNMFLKKFNNFDFIFFSNKDLLSSTKNNVLNDEGNIFFPAMFDLAGAKNILNDIFLKLPSSSPLKYKRIEDYKYNILLNKTSNNIIFKKKCNENWISKNYSKKFIINGYACLFTDNRNNENAVLEFQGNRNFKVFLTISFLTILFCILYIISILIFVLKEKYKKKKYV